MAYTTTVTSKGTITLPVQIRRSLNVKPGDRLIITKVDNNIIATADNYDQKMQQLRKNAEKHLKARGMWGLSIEEIHKKSRQAREDYYQEKYGIKP